MGLFPFKVLFTRSDHPPVALVAPEGATCAPSPKGTAHRGRPPAVERRASGAESLPELPLHAPRRTARRFERPEPVDATCPRSLSGLGVADT
jgi:hypothetical protein